MRALRQNYHRAFPEKELGDFHDAVLGEGALPLGVLEGHVLGEKAEAVAHDRSC
jgi:uncharacterized protein (DUF885 family)